MTDEELREAVLAVVKRHNPDADEVRGVAAGLEQYAERLDAMEECL